MGDDRLFRRMPTGPTCRMCPLGGLAAGYPAPFGSGFATPYGEMRSGVMLVTEALDSTEDVKQERALAGRGGFLLQRAAARRGWKLREEFRIVPALFCKPSHGVWRPKAGTLQPWAADAILACESNLDREIAERQPKVIVALGEAAFTALTGLQYDIMGARGYVFRDRKDRCWVVPTFDPTWVLMGQQVNAHVLLWDLEKARRIAETGHVPDMPPCLLDPPLDVWEAYVADFLVDPTRPLALDIETPWKADEDEDALVVEVIKDPTARDVSYQIDRVSFAYRRADGTDAGVSVPWGMPYLPGIRQLIAAASAALEETR